MQEKNQTNFFLSRNLEEQPATRTGNRSAAIPAMLQMNDFQTIPKRTRPSSFVFLFLPC